MRKKSIGLALGGGGARGLAHIGVIKAIIEAGIPIDYIAGTSMGALVGGWYAARHEVSTLEQVFVNIHDRDVKPIRRLLRERGGDTLFRDPHMLEALERKIAGKTLEECRTPFRAVATDVRTGDEIAIKEGSLLEAIRASCALPIAFKPIPLRDRLLIDGGFVNPVPADVVRAMGAEYVIAVDVSTSWHDFSEDRPKSIADIFSYTLQAVEYQLARKALASADIVLRPTVLQFNLLSFKSANDIIEAGYREAKANIRRILKSAGYEVPERTPFEKFMDFLTYGFEE